VVKLASTRILNGCGAVLYEGEELKSPEDIILWCSPLIAGFSGIFAQLAANIKLKDTNTRTDRFNKIKGKNYNNAVVILVHVLC